MKIYTHETISNIYDEDRKLISTNTSESYILYPSEGKVLRNTLNGITTGTYFGVSSKDAIKNYSEIDKEE